MDWLFSRPSPDQANHWLALVSLTMFAIGVIAAGVVNSRPALPPFGNKHTQRFVGLASSLVGWICGVGLFFGIIRVLQIDPATLGRPFWIVLTWIVLVAAIGGLISKAPADRELRNANEKRLRNRRALRQTRSTAV